MTTKKLLVSYDASNPAAGQGDFLVVTFEGSTPVFFGLRSRRAHAIGRIVYLGREISEKDLFARFVDAGVKIANVDQTLMNLVSYVDQLGSFGVGNILNVVPTSGAHGFKLMKVAESPVPIDSPKSIP